MYGINWRALLALLVSIVPALPGLAYNVNPSLNIGGALYIAQFNWYYGFLVALTAYAGLSAAMPARETLVPHMITELDDETADSGSLGDDETGEEGKFPS